MTSAEAESLSHILDAVQCHVAEQGGSWEHRFQRTNPGTQKLSVTIYPGKIDLTSRVLLVFVFGPKEGEKEAIKRIGDTVTGLWKVLGSLIGQEGDAQIL